MKIKKRNISLNLIICTISVALTSCDNSRQIDENESIKSLHRNIAHTLSSGNGETYKFEPKDTLVKINNTIYLSVFKNSFLRTDSSIYDGEVILHFKFQTHPDSIMKELKRNPDLEMGMFNVFGSVYFDAKGQDGETLILNPQSQPLLYFPYYSNLFSTIKEKKIISSQLDTRSHQYNMEIIDFTPLVQFASRKVDIENYDYLIANDFIMDSLYNEKTHTKRTFHDTLAYTITLKAGYTKLAWQEWANASPTEIKIDVVNLDKTIMDGYIKVILLTKAQAGGKVISDSHNFYLVGEKYGGSMFVINKPENMYQFKSLQLPLDKKYILFVYGTLGGKYYCKSKKDVRLKQSNLLKIKVEEVSQDELLNQINNL